RDQDIIDYGICYCALYVSKDVAAGTTPVSCIPDRRPPPGGYKTEETEGSKPSVLPEKHTLPFPVYRCRVCGYLCARTSPPETCPICGASSDRFEKYLK
ncbi:rubredoxin-like domain-containing protein, partial [Methanogenium sp. MK-MG]|uniref:rubredoxin-like domain-containing protein n=1 Tax=Methanogenium sp. MK-MG TaxID=2599926 RepID=UPI00352BBB3A